MRQEHEDNMLPQRLEKGEHQGRSGQEACTLLSQISEVEKLQEGEAYEALITWALRSHTLKSYTGEFRCGPILPQHFAKG